MSARERRLQGILVEYLDEETGLYNEPEKLVEQIAKENPDQMPTPGCRKCYGVGTRGTIVQAMRSMGGKNGANNKRAPIRTSDKARGIIIRNSIWCSCIYKNLNTMKRMAEEHNESHGPTDSTEDQSVG